MTKFVKELFTSHGGYIHYTGDYEGRPVYEEPCHPTRLGKGKDLFIARHKYKKPGVGYINFIIKNFTVEEWVEAVKTNAPLKVMESKGYLLPWVKKMVVEAGYPGTPEGRDQYLKAKHS
jgi:hypothetical protein